MSRRPRANRYRKPVQFVLTYDDASSGWVAVVIETANNPWGSWKNAYALRYTNAPADLPLARTSTTHSAIWLTTTYPAVQPDSRSIVVTAVCRHANTGRRCTPACR